MKVYYATIIAILILALFGATGRGRDSYDGEIMWMATSEKIAAFLMTLILCLVAGLRYKVGTDYGTYYMNYTDYRDGELSLLNEPGIRVIAKFSAFINDRPETMIFLAATITVCVFCLVTIRNSETYWLSIILYVFTGCWHGCFNGIRQYLAAAVLFAGSYTIREGKFWKWCIYVAIASMFHITAVVAIFFYPFGRMKVSWKQIIIVLAVITVGWRLYDQIFGMIDFLKNTETTVMYSYYTRGINPLRIAVTWVPIVVIIVWRYNFDFEDPDVKFHFNMTLMNAALMTVATNSTYFGRIGIYTMAYLTLSWPFILNRLSVQNRKILLVLLLLFYFMYWRTEASSDSLRNFQWTFSKLNGF